MFASSGSSGESKWILLTRDALLHSARVVNRHLGVMPEDFQFPLYSDVFLPFQEDYANAPRWTSYTQGLARLADRAKDIPSQDAQVELSAVVVDSRCPARGGDRRRGLDAPRRRLTRLNVCERGLRPARHRRRWRHARPSR